jgi:uncharacterized protein YkwD
VRSGRPPGLIHFSDGTSVALAQLTPFSMCSLRRILVIGFLVIGVPAVAASGAAGASTQVESLLATRDACPSGYQRDAPLAVQVRAMACLIAFARARVGVQPLRLSPTLDRVAALKVDADLACREFSHTPCGRDFMTWFAAAGYGVHSSRYAVAENLAWGRGVDASPQQIMRMWLDSPEHRKNLLSPLWREFGLGVRLQAAFQGGSGTAVWANEFGSLQDARAFGASVAP